MPPPDVAEVPPQSGPFSTTNTLAPAWAARSAAVSAGGAGTDHQQVHLFVESHGPPLLTAYKLRTFYPV